MKKVICVFFAVLLFLSAAPEVDAVMDPICQRYDIWSRCYMNVSYPRCGQDRMEDKDSIIPFETCGQQCFLDDDRDGICDNRENCERQDGIARGNYSFGGNHGDRGGRRTGFRGGR